MSDGKTYHNPAAEMRVRDAEAAVIEAAVAMDEAQDEIAKYDDGDLSCDEITVPIDVAALVAVRYENFRAAVRALREVRQ